MFAYFDIFTVPVGTDISVHREGVSEYLTHRVVLLPRYYHSRLCLLGMSQYV